MPTEETVTTDVKVSDAEIDNLVGRGIIRVLRYVGNFVYSLADVLLPMFFYIGILVLVLFNILIAVDGVDAVDINCFYNWAFCVLAGIIWLTLERLGAPARLAKWLKIDEV
jgi:hypothetical protein